MSNVPYKVVGHCGTEEIYLSSQGDLIIIQIGRKRYTCSNYDAAMRFLQQIICRKRGNKLYEITRDTEPEEESI